MMHPAILLRDPVTSQLGLTVETAFLTVFLLGAAIFLWRYPF
jgi:hypothetical protein